MNRCDVGHRDLFDFTRAPYGQRRRDGIRVQLVEQKLKPVRPGSFTHRFSLFARPLADLIGKQDEQETSHQIEEDSIEEEIRYQNIGRDYGQQSHRGDEGAAA